MLLLFPASRHLQLLIRSLMQYCSHCSRPILDSLSLLQVCITLTRVSASVTFLTVMVIAVFVCFGYTVYFVVFLLVEFFVVTLLTEKGS